MHTSSTQVLSVETRQKPKRRRQSVTEELLLLLPATLLLLCFLVIPFVLSIYLSFTDQRLVPNPVPTGFVGLQNYKQVLTDPAFWQAFRNTVYFAVLVVPFQCAISLGVAVLLNSSFPLRSFFRSVAILPLMTPITVTIVVWAAFYRIPDGLFNNIIKAFGAETYVDWLGSPTWAMPAIVLLSAWATFPFQMLLYLAGLQDIPHERYEAVRMDGANAWQQFRYVTFPGLRNVNILILITTTIQAFKLFTQVDILTRGGPVGATNTLVRYMIQQGYTSQLVGFGSAVAVIFVVIVGSLAILQRVLLKNE
ncbi:multiple sugar transport system permease protein [Deinococcus hopiensis KR-140]|uniref:Multiple sugar transport system permease protein n=1 Tax=Deinococcus hopiensis KR-140 TaxID=695939 RepID=A0A1W1UVJ0_9DEIO|nr:multiple sugar transport system permease protein [Deinococcus hopiensis KR-140]